MLWGLKLKNPFWLPRNKQGLIDQKPVFQIIHGELKQPYGVLDDMTVSEVSWLLESNTESKKDYYEMISYSVKNAMISINSGKDRRMFDEETKEKKLTKEQRTEELSELEKTFGKL